MSEEFNEAILQNTNTIGKDNKKDMLKDKRPTDFSLDMIGGDQEAMIAAMIAGGTSEVSQTGELERKSKMTAQNEGQLAQLDQMSKPRSQYAKSRHSRDRARIKTRGT